MSGVLHTIGYQGLAVGTLLDTLREVGTRRLIDVRAVPLSRKPGFGRRQLAAALAEAGIEYVHLPALGTPKPGRDAARRGDRVTLERVFRAHLATETAIEALAAAAALVAGRPSCLLCFEADPSCCHRAIVADVLAPATALRPCHLRPLGPGPARRTPLHGHGAA